MPEPFAAVDNSRKLSCVVAQAGLCVSIVDFGADCCKVLLELFSESLKALMPFLFGGEGGWLLQPGVRSLQKL